MEKVEVQIDYSVDELPKNNIRQVLINGVKVPRVTNVKVDIDPSKPVAVILTIIPDKVKTNVNAPRTITPPKGSVIE